MAGPYDRETEIAGPDSEITGMNSEITGPATEITSPATGITGPDSEITSPATGITAIMWLSMPVMPLRSVGADLAKAPETRPMLLF